MAPGFFSESRALYLQKTVRTDSPNVHKLDFLVPYFMVFVYKSQGPGGQSFNWLMHYKQVYIEIILYILARDLQTMFNQTLQYNFKIVLLC